MVAALSSPRMAPRVSRYLAAGDGTSSILSSLSAIPRLTSLSVKQQTILFTHSRAPSSAPRRSVLEVERKFAPTAASVRQLDQNTGEPPFKSVIHKGVTCFQDTYYDTPKDNLSTAGVWIRRRKKFECGRLRFAPIGPAGPCHVSWEAKVRVRGDFINSAFREITDMQDISTILSNLVPGAELDAQHGPQGGQMRELARFVTNRTGYVIDGKFTVVIDVTDFGHTIGEVELEKDTSEALCEGEGTTLTIDAMDKEVGGLMKRFIWAFPSGTPVGKLTAYFDHKNNKRPGGQG